MMSVARKSHIKGDRWPKVLCEAQRLNHWATSARSCPAVKPLGFTSRP